MHGTSAARTGTGAHPATPLPVVLRRLGGALLVLGAVATVTVLATLPLTRPVVHYLARYSPMQLAHGDVVSVVGSAFLVGHPTMLGLTTVFAAILFVPYTLVGGVHRAGIVGMSGHCVSTLAVAAVVLPAAALGSNDALHIARMGDYGASAALAAMGGGLAMRLARRVPLAGGLVLAGLIGFFGLSLASHADAMHNVADVEHLLALGTGAIVEHLLAMRDTRRDALRRPTPPASSAS